MIRTAVAKLFSTSPYSASRNVDHVPKLPREKFDAYEERVWREKAHVSLESGNVVVPRQALKLSLMTSSSALSEKLRGAKTYTSLFTSSVRVPNDMDIGIKPADCQCADVYCHADGKRGSGKRVWRKFPVIENWAGAVTFVVYDPAITDDVFERHLIYCGVSVGIGRWRPQVGGEYGTFGVESIEWQEQPIVGKGVSHVVSTIRSNDSRSTHRNARVASTPRQVGER